MNEQQTQRVVDRATDFAQRVEDIATEVTAAKKVQRERRFQTWAITVATAVSLWQLGATLDSKTTLAEIKPRLDNIDIRLSGAYMATDAGRDVSDLNHRIDAVQAIDVVQDKRIEKIESIVVASPRYRP